MPLPPLRRVQLPPFLVVGIDHAGVQRAYDYLPYPPGEGLAAFRPEARTWPGGGVDAYLDAIFLEVRRASHEWLVIHTMPCHSYHIMFITGSRYYDMWYRHGACLSVFV